MKLRIAELSISHLFQLENGDNFEGEGRSAKIGQFGGGDVVCLDFLHVLIPVMRQTINNIGDLKLDMLDDLRF
jgi:hypothetical protein